MLDLKALPLVASGEDHGSTWRVLDGRLPVPAQPDAIGLRIEVTWSDGEFSAADSIMSPLGSPTEHRALAVFRDDGQGAMLLRVDRSITEVAIDLGSGPGLAGLFDSPVGDRVGVMLIPAGRRERLAFTLRRDDEVVSTGRVIVRAPG